MEIGSGDFPLPDVTKNKDLVAPKSWTSGITWSGFLCVEWCFSGVFCWRKPMILKGFLFENCEDSPECADSDLCSGRSQKLQGLPVDRWRYHMPSIHHWCNQCWMISDKKWPRSPVAMGWVQGANFKLEVSIRHELDLIDYLFPAFWMCSIDL